MQAGQISESRFAYRTTGLGMSIIGGAVIGAEMGGPWGAAAGAFIGLGVTAGEIAYDGLNWLWNETERQIGNFKRAVGNGCILVDNEVFCQFKEPPDFSQSDSILLFGRYLRFVLLGF